LKWCRIGVSGDCSGGKSCASFTTTYTYGSHSYGVCN
jgi:hypothetical protein